MAAIEAPGARQRLLPDHASRVQPGLDEFFEWYEHEQRSGFAKATVCAWRVASARQVLNTPDITTAKGLAV